MAVKEYLEKLAQEGGMDEATKAAFLKVISNNELLKPLQDGFLRQEDYSRKMDEVSTTRKAVETQIAQWRDWYNVAVERDAAREAELIELRKKAGGSGGDGGSGGAGGGAGGAGGPGYLSKADFEKLMAQERGQLIGLTKDAMRIAARHAVEFPKVPFDVNAIEKIALEKGLTVEKAYDEYIRPQVEERNKADVEARIAAARAEGLKEGLSKHGLPDDASTPRGHHVLFDRPKPDATPDTRSRVTNFVEAWNSANAPKQ